MPIVCQCMTLTQRMKKKPKNITEGQNYYQWFPLRLLTTIAIMELFFFIINAKNSHPEMIAKTHQIRVENNVCFIVDLDELQEPQDLLLNALCSWEQLRKSIF